MQNWNNKKVVVIGAARQGLALSRWLASKGAQVILTDARPAEQLLAETAFLNGYDIQLSFGGHPFELLNGCETLCLSGGVPPTIPFVREAKQRHIPLSNDSQIFLDACPAPVVGITGSAGKTTTTSLMGIIATEHFKMKQSGNRVWVGGNIGHPLIEDVDTIHEDDLAIMELSSFQLELMRRSPQISAVLNITPNHLDRHGSLEVYADAKAHILRFQKQGDVAILNRDDIGSWRLLPEVRSDLISFGLKRPAATDHGIYVENDWIWAQIARNRIKMFPTDWIRLRGQHNLYNVLAACALSLAAGLALPAIHEAVEGFTGVSHRLQLVRELHGAEWYNDSIATAPERSMAAVNAFEQPIILLLGGRDKSLPWEDLLSLVRQKVKALILFGEAGPMIQNTLGASRSGDYLQSIQLVSTLQEAVQAAALKTEEGDVVLLSPGGTSYDAFKDFEERGEAYTTWVNQLS